MIKLTIGGYEVTLSAKDVTMGDTRNNVGATEAFLNELSMYMGENVDSKRSQQFANDIYDALSARGLYKNIA